MSTSQTIPISTDSRRLARGLRRFRFSLVAALGILALACVSLGAASVLQGPRIQSATLDLPAAVSVPTPLRLVFDEALTPLREAQVTVTPAVPLTVDVDGDVVIIHLGQALRYSTHYDIRLERVSGIAGGVQVELHHEFTTPGFTPTVLQRAPSGDRIMMIPDDRQPVQLALAARIENYLPLSGAVLLVTEGEAQASDASIVATDGSGNTEQLTLPGGSPGQVQLLEKVGTTVLYTFTTLDDSPGDGLPVFDDTLFALDLNGTHISDPINGIDGKPLSVDRIIPVPGSNTALIHARGGDVYTLDVGTPGTPPTLLASYSELAALAPDRSHVSARDAFGFVSYDLTDGSESRIDPSPMRGTGAVPYISDPIPFSRGWIERVALPNADQTAFDTFIGVDDGTAADVLLDADGDRGAVLDFWLTPNEQYLVAEVAPTGDFFDTSDGYATGARPRDVETVVVDMETKQIISTWDGSHPRW